MLTAPVVVGSIALSLTGTPAIAVEPAPRPALDPALRDALASATRAMDAAATHTVRAGDTVSRIAAANGLRTADVLSWNGLDWSAVIHPGDVLRLTPATAAGPAPAPVAASAPAAAHTVVAGDTLWAVARAHGVSVAAVAQANGMGPDAVIYPGRTLALPTAGATAPGAGPAPAAAPVAPAPAAAAIHTVVAGDTVGAIAARHGLAIDAVLSANALDRTSIIYPGQDLVIPGGDIVPAAAVASVDTAALGLDEEQIANARLIIQVGRERGVPDRGIAIALATAMVESWIRNLDWGDRDSLGLFQQRPSTGWGSPEQVLDPTRSIAAFYGGPADPNGAETRGLLDIAGWESLAFTDAAQAVQISAYPERYGEWEAQAYSWLAALG
ncbi:LysM peptidoglycan-binding domain-containing protein [Microbacterium radiodurans]|uniref:LysM peptidoglycan-binding domain-containing protein n=1 Tax=Microbacterium radiodurans TaxID=661398 RepID=UPI001CC4254D|nr:LysM peptidoglycan-binding domain-containing protein [Microbacterium radiodurans]